MKRSNKQLEQILRLIPGYDPFATSCELRHEKAWDAIDFFPECLVHIEGKMADKPFILEPWEQAIIGNLFGWYRPDGSRRYREGLVFVPRKNGKTPLASGIALNVLFCDEEIGQQNYIAAADREQAGKLFRYAKGMRDKSEEMSARSRVYGGHAEAGQSRSIVLEHDASFLRVIAADAHVQHGGTSHLIVVDELHAQQNRELVDVLITSMASANRINPMILYFTTSDFEREGSICNEKYDYASKVRDGVIHDDSFLPVIYQASPDEDWTDPEVWKKANPNLGVSVSEDYLRRECLRAQETPAYQNTFKRLHLNIRTAQEQLWIDYRRWQQCQQAIDWDSFKGATCWGGLDLASRTDLTAFVLCFPRGAKFYLKSWFWLPIEALRNRKNARMRHEMMAWSQAGHMTATATLPDTTDYEFVRQVIADASKQYDLIDVGFDPYNATDTALMLKKNHAIEMVEFRQGTLSMNEPSKEFERLVLCGDMVHDGNPVMNWCLSNCQVSTDAAGNIKPVKPAHHEENKIDGAVAAIMALGRTMANLSEASIYNSREMIVL